MSSVADAAGTDARKSPTAGLRNAVGRETVFVRVALSIVALHVVDDAFLQPQPSTSAADHVVSGLVPLAVLGLAAVMYPHLRAGWRAALTLTFGLFAVVAGVGEAGYYSINVGPSGDDYTGLLAVPAGLLLIGRGCMTLWVSRRGDDSLSRRYLRRLLMSLGALILLYVILLPFALGYVFTHAARAVVPVANLGSAYEQVSFRTSDGLVLRGWYVPSKNGAAVMAVPGRAGTQRQARMLARHGYGVLVFDRRGEGESDGDPNAFGWAGDRDLKSALAFLQDRPDVHGNAIGGIGLSVGGEMLLQAAAESDGFKAVVSDGAGARSIREDLARSGAGKWLEIPSSLAISAATAIFSNHLPPPSLERLVARIAPGSVFFINGEDDQPNVRELTPSYYAAAHEPKLRWEVAGAGHIGGITARPAEYEQRVLAFFDSTLLEGK